MDSCIGDLVNFPRPHASVIEVLCFNGVFLKGAVLNRCRTATPWVMVVFHGPVYHTYVSTPFEHPSF